MARIRAGTWRTILVIGAVVLALAMLVSGLFSWFVAVLIVLLAMGGGALLYKTLGPPTR